MSDPAPTSRHDPWTVAALAVIAACASTFAHEAMGHGGACLVRGGTITQLTSVYFACEPRSSWIAAAGPAGNLLAALVAGLSARATPLARPRVKLLLTLIMTFSLFWEAGYVIEAMAREYGDLYFAGYGAFGTPTLWWRIAGVVLGLGFYLLGARVVSAGLRPFPGVARTAWLTGAITLTLVASAYAPDRAGAMVQGVLSIGAASWPLLLWRSRGDTAETAVIARSPTWIGLAVVVFAALTATLGRGMP